MQEGFKLGDCVEIVTDEDNFYYENGEIGVIIAFAGRGCDNFIVQFSDCKDDVTEVPVEHLKKIID